MISSVLFSFCLIASIYAQQCDKLCKFDANDADDCLVLGAEPNAGPLIFWPKASQDCLDAFNIKAEAVDPVLLKSMFPNADGSNGNVNSFVNFLKNGNNQAIKGFKISFPEFFDENGNLLDSVSYDATTKNCKVSQSDCYNLMKTYLENDTDGAKIMQEIGETLHENARKDIELQQSLVRNRLCQTLVTMESDEEDAVAKCGENLKSKVILLSENQLKNAPCTSYSFGPGTRSCVENGETSSGTTAGGAGTTIATTGNNNNNNDDGDDSDGVCSNQCCFDKSDDVDCVVVGAAPNNGELIGWEKAEQQCLTALNIKSQAIEQSLLTSMFPNRDGSNVDVNAFVQYLRFDQTMASKGFRISFPDFFDENGNLKDQVRYDGQYIDCKANKNDCYNAFKQYLASDAKAKNTMREIGETLYETAAKDRELEQSTARIQLCQITVGFDQDDSSADEKISACQSLAAQVEKLSKTVLKDAKVDNEVQCSSYGIGPGTRCGVCGSFASSASALTLGVAVVVAMAMLLI